MRERRRHVRIKPTPALPARAALVGQGPFREACDVIDVSVSGLSITSPALRDVVVGSAVKLVVTFGPKSEYAVDAVTRWVAGESAGMELIDAPPHVSEAMQWYVGELLEQGASM